MYSWVTHFPSLCTASPCIKSVKRKTPFPLRYKVLPGTKCKALGRTSTNHGRENAPRKTKCAQTTMATDMHLTALWNKQTLRVACKKAQAMPSRFIPGVEKCLTKLQSCKKRFLAPKERSPAIAPTTAAHPSVPKHRADSVN